MESFYYSAGMRSRTVWCVWPIVRLGNNSCTSGDLPSSAPQSTEFRQENRASPMRAIIALLDDGRCEPSRNLTGKLSFPPAGLIYSESVGSRNFETITSNTG